eukprot:PhM_4_TR8559/c0_g1_i1/m.35238
MSVKDLTIVNLGTIKQDARFFVSSVGPNRCGACVPVGYKSVRLARTYMGALNCKDKVKYTQEVRENSETGAPEYVIVAEDDEENPVVSTTAVGAWEIVYERMRSKDTIGDVGFTNIRGFHFFGLAEPSIIEQIKALDGAAELIELANSKKKKKSPKKDAPNQDEDDADVVVVSSAETTQPKKRSRSSNKSSAAAPSAAAASCALCGLSTPFCPQTGKLHVSKCDKCDTDAPYCPMTGEPHVGLVAVSNAPSTKKKAPAKKKSEVDVDGADGENKKLKVTKGDVATGAAKKSDVPPPLLDAMSKTLAYEAKKQFFDTKKVALSRLHGAAVIHAEDAAELEFAYLSEREKLELCQVRAATVKRGAPKKSKAVTIDEDENEEVDGGDDTQPLEV